MRKRNLQDITTMKLSTRVACYLFTACMLSAHFADYALSNPVDPKALSDLIGTADRLVVKHNSFEEDQILYESRDKNDLKELTDSLLIKISEQFHCMCEGSPKIFFYKGDKEIGWISSHHGLSVRTSLWESDALLSNSDKWLSWFDKRKIDYPRKEYEEMRVSEAQRKVDYARWQENMPKSLKPIWDTIDQDDIVDSSVATQMDIALAKDVVDPQQRILQLLGWFGSGEGPWSGFPSYEEVAEQILLKYTTSDIVGAIMSTTPTEAQLEGAARLICGWDFSKQRQDGQKDIPDSVKDTLWKHVVRTANTDNIERARKALGR